MKQKITFIFLLAILFANAAFSQAKERVFYASFSPQVYIPVDVDPPFRFMLTHHSGDVDPSPIFCWIRSFRAYSGMLTQVAIKYFYLRLLSFRHDDPFNI